MDGKSDVAGLGAVGEKCVQVADEARQIARAEPEGGALGLDLGDFEDVVEQSEQVFAVAVDGLEPFAPGACLTPLLPPLEENSTRAAEPQGSTACNQSAKAAHSQRSSAPGRQHR